MKKTTKKLLLCTALTAVTAISGKSQAQDAPEGALVLDPVVITGTRIAQPASELAGNTAVLEADEITLSSHDNPAELLNRLPGVYIHSNDGQEHLTAIRSPVLTGGAGQGSFLYLEDGIPLRATGWGNVNGLFDAHFETADRIEVVRGPGSALYGSNAVHGLINVITPDPSFTAERTLSYETGGHRDKGSADVTGPLSDKTAYRASVSVLEDSSFREHANVGQQKATLSVLHDDGPDRIKLLVSGQNLNQETAGFIRGFEAYRDGDLARSNPNPEAFRDAWALRASARWDRELNDSMTLSITPFARVNDMEFLRHFVPDQSLEETGHWSAGAQSALYIDLEGGHTLVAGLDLEYTDGYLKETQARPTFGSFPQGIHYDFEATQIVVAPYVHAEWQVTPTTRVTTGVRFDWTRYDYDNKTASNTVGRFQRPADRTDDFFNVTPKLGVVQALSDDVEIYANLARAARAPQVTDLYRLQVNQAVGDVESETLDSIEIGTRATIGPVTASLAAFYAEKDNFFFRDADGFNVTDGETSHRGIELDAFAELPFGFDLGVSGAYAVHQYEFDRPITSPAQQTEAIRSGTDIDTAPRWTGNARLGWSLDDRARAELEYVYVDEYFVDAANINEYDGHQVLNLRARYQVTDNLEITGRIMNLGNVEFAERADFAFGSFRYFPGEPRTAYIGTSVSF
ncbi:TonB-dependent receptor [Pyruvatibacter mobilis]|uniref:TonB-dependent receptor n=1 Tax=Pyruvatibacter mobilis TaxID=1712261 RepID=A0A845Q883_9HYPH|nr:TonB-dependent receptor [Pyruvatibacter mobilis]NBG94637.1 TonB-dependent receptor [Pyruvatibacter mobilis]QJD74147.1 TonB-dependent receptor [Pyruvatibacter mobilis]GGD04537.1 TonB-dependent receptor [Pyruvatibacter mobilis]